jgi:adenine-specific DNA-methyltransferase
MNNLELFVESQTQVARIELPKFPATRYQGSKRKIVEPLAAAFSTLQFERALDLFSGSGTVSLLLRHLGKKVDSNDYLVFNKVVAELLLTATRERLKALNPEKELDALLYTRTADTGTVVEDKYDGIFFTKQENREIDQFATNVQRVDPFRRALYIYSVGQALMKKRPYNLFHRANLDMRLKDVKRSFGNAVTWEGSIKEHALKAIRELNAFNFPDLPNEGVAHSIHVQELERLPDEYDLIYADPPYMNGRGLETNYSNFYGFLNGLCDYSKFAEGDDSYPHKPVLMPDSGWRNEITALHQITRIAKRWPTATIVCSYRSDGLPSGERLREALAVDGRQSVVHSFGEFKYALSRTDTNEELYVVSQPQHRIEVSPH